MKAKSSYNLFTKIRSALRGVWLYSPAHREALAKAVTKDPKTGNYFFDCPICKTNWHKAMASVDHQPPCGPLNSWDDLVPFCKRLFEGNVRVIDKMCHKTVTAAQRRKRG